MPIQGIDPDPEGKLMKKSHLITSACITILFFCAAAATVDRVVLIEHFTYTN